jgi:hypothetical protein
MPASAEFIVCPCIELRLKSTYNTHPPQPSSIILITATPQVCNFPAAEQLALQPLSSYTPTVAPRVPFVNAAWAAGCVVIDVAGGTGGLPPVASLLSMPRSLLVFQADAYTHCLHGIEEVRPTPAAAIWQRSATVATAAAATVDVTTAAVLVLHAQLATAWYAHMQTSPEDMSVQPIVHTRLCRS